MLSELEIYQIKQLVSFKYNKVAAKEDITEEIVMDQLRSDDNTIMVERVNVTDKQSVILSKPTINTKAD